MVEHPLGEEDGHVKEEGKARHAKNQQPGGGPGQPAPPGHRPRQQEDGGHDKAVEAQKGRGGVAVRGEKEGEKLPVGVAQELGDRLPADVEGGGHRVVPLGKLHPSEGEGPLEPRQVEEGPQSHHHNALAPEGQHLPPAPALQQHPHGGHRHQGGGHRHIGLVDAHGGANAQDPRQKAPFEPLQQEYGPHRQQQGQHEKVRPGHIAGGEQGEGEIHRENGAGQDLPSLGADVQGPDHEQGGQGDKQQGEHPDEPGGAQAVAQGAQEGLEIPSQGDLPGVVMGGGDGVEAVVGKAALEVKVGVGGKPCQKRSPQADLPLLLPPGKFHLRFPPFSAFFSV